MPTSARPLARTPTRGGSARAGENLGKAVAFSQIATPSHADAADVRPCLPDLATPMERFRRRGSGQERRPELSASNHQVVRQVELLRQRWPHDLDSSFMSLELMNDGCSWCQWLPMVQKHHQQARWMPAMSILAWLACLDFTSRDALRGPYLHCIEIGFLRAFKACCAWARRVSSLLRWLHRGKPLQRSLAVRRASDWGPSR